MSQISGGDGARDDFQLNDEAGERFPVFRRGDEFHRRPAAPDPRETATIRLRSGNFHNKPAGRRRR